MNLGLPQSGARRHLGLTPPARTVAQPLGSAGVRRGQTGQVHNAMFNFGKNGKLECLEPFPLHLVRDVLLMMWVTAGGSHWVDANMAIGVGVHDSLG